MRESYRYSKEIKHHANAVYALLASSALKKHVGWGGDPDGRAIVIPKGTARKKWEYRRVIPFVAQGVPLVGNYNFSWTMRGKETEFLQKLEQALGNEYEVVPVKQLRQDEQDRMFNQTREGFLVIPKSLVARRDELAREEREDWRRILVGGTTENALDALEGAETDDEKNLLAQDIVERFHLSTTKVAQWMASEPELRERMFRNLPRLKQFFSAVPEKGWREVVGEHQAQISPKLVEEIQSSLRWMNSFGTTGLRLLNNNKDVKDRAVFMLHRALDVLQGVAADDVEGALVAATRVIVGTRPKEFLHPFVGKDQFGRAVNILSQNWTDVYDAIGEGAVGLPVEEIWGRMMHQQYASMMLIALVVFAQEELRWGRDLGDVSKSVLHLINLSQAAVRASMVP